LFQLKLLEESTEQLNRDMIARHFCLMALESLILIIIAVTCFGARQTRSVDESNDKQKRFQIYKKEKIIVV